MKFRDELDPKTKTRIDSCDSRLMDPSRLAALARTGLMDTPNDPAFDRLARLAAQILKVPLTIISLVGDKKQFFKAGFGLPPPFDTIREIPIGESICRYTLTGQDIIAGDALQDALLMYHPTTEPWGISAFMALPMITKDGFVLGAFCAVDTVVHNWTDEEVYLMRELTNSVMTEIQLRTQIQDLADERSLREQFVASLSHDLRNPIGIAKMSAQILADESSDLEERKKLTTMICENMERADRMIRDLLDVTKLKAGEPMPLDIAECELESVLKSTVESLSSVFGGRVVLKSQGRVTGYWDALALRRVTENLIVNGFKYGSAETPVTVSLNTQPDRVTIEVHNYGNPIDSLGIEELFEPFRRSETAQKSHKKGWGIGLALVRGFADAHGGSVRVKSDEKLGTVFSVELPMDSREGRKHS